MKKKKILLIGSASSIYMKQYIENVLLPLEMDIILISTSEIFDEEYTYYASRNIFVTYLFKKNKSVHHIKKLGNILAARYNLKNINKMVGEFDYVHFHYIGNQKLIKYLISIYKKMCKKIIVTFWGSDILNIDRNIAKRINPLLEVSDTIVLSTDSMINAFKSYFGDIYNNKITSILFGNPMIEFILNNNGSVEKEKRKFSEDKINISIGYNGSKRQNHIDIIESIGRLDKDLRKKLFIIVQLSYGLNDTHYRNLIINNLKMYDLDFYIIDKFLDMKETLEFKYEVDIFIHGQDSDALSSSVLEYIYTGALVINPVWIDYKEWKELGITYKEYNDFYELTDILKNNIQKKNITENISNKNIIEKIFSWKYQSNNWQKLY